MPPISPKAAEWKGLPLADWQLLNDVNERLEQALRFQIEIPRLRKQIAELKIEKTLNDAEYGSQSRQVHEKTVKRCKTSHEALRVSALLEVVAQKGKIGFFAKLGFRFKHGIKLTKDLLAALGDTIDHLQNKYTHLRWQS